MLHVLQNVMNQEVQTLWHKEEQLPGFDTEDCIVLPGGFSYGDYLRSGAIARFSPIMKAVIDFANKGGKVIGICNGFQILCEAGLLPGALAHNDTEKFICKNVHLRCSNTQTLLTNSVPQDKVLKIPIAHAEGRYFADEKTLDEIKRNGQILFQYCDELGNVNSDTNVNGSEMNIAGICNGSKNVFGMMPHPERAAEGQLGNEDGRYLFESILQGQQVLAS